MDLDPTIIQRGKTLTEDLKNALTRPVKKEDIKEAMFSIQDDKAPGYDGFTSCFFKKHGIL